MVQFLLDQIKKDLRVWWQHPISALALVGLGAMAWNIHLSERIKIMEQRIAAQAAPVVGQSAVVPLPSPISLGILYIPIGGERAKASGTRHPVTSTQP